MKFEIHLNSGKIVEVEAGMKSAATTVAISLGKMNKMDCYDIVDIIEVDPRFNSRIQKIVESTIEVKENEKKERVVKSEF